MEEKGLRSTPVLGLAWRWGHRSKKRWIHSPGSEL